MLYLQEYLILLYWHIYKLIHWYILYLLLIYFLSIEYFYIDIITGVPRPSLSWYMLYLIYIDIFIFSYWEILHWYCNRSTSSHPLLDKERSVCQCINGGNFPGGAINICIFICINICINICFCICICAINICILRMIQLPWGAIKFLYLYLCNQYLCFVFVSIFVFCICFCICAINTCILRMIQLPWGAIKRYQRKYKDNGFHNGFHIYQYLSSFLLYQAVRSSSYYPLFVSIFVFVRFIFVFVGFHIYQYLSPLPGRSILTSSHRLTKVNLTFHCGHIFISGPSENTLSITSHYKLPTMHKAMIN